MRKPVVWSLALVFFLTGAAATRAQDSGLGARPSLRIGSSAGSIRLDGELREAAWETADSIATLTQVEPTQGAAPSARTVVRVIATADAIIFGIRAENPPGVAPVAFARQRDAL